LLAMRSISGGTISDDQAVRDVVRGGITQLLQATVIAPAGRNVTSSDISSRNATLPQALGKYFVGLPLSRYAGMLQQAVADEAQSAEHDVDGGTKETIFTTIEVSGTSATVAARSLDWVQRAPIGNNPADAEISGWWDYKVHLSKTEAGWRIDAISFSPETGSEP
jgi:hypothetical protein